MAELQLELPVAVPAAELHHLVHCDDDGAICGEDVAGHAWRPGLRVTCPICAAMRRCPDCEAELEVRGG